MVRAHVSENRLGKNQIRVTYVTRSFLDYRIPVLEALSAMLDGELWVIYSQDYIPRRVSHKMRQRLGRRAVGMKGEMRIGPNQFVGFANTSMRFVYQPGVLSTIAKTRPQMIIGDGFFQWTSFALLYKMAKGIPLVVCYERTFHTERNAQWFRKAYRRFVVKLVDAMACNGQLSRDYVLSLGVSPLRITTGQMAADTEDMRRQAESVPASGCERLRKKWRIPDVVFLSIGRLIRLKGFRELLLAWAQIERKVPGIWALVIIGTGPEEDKLKRLSRELDLKSVHLLGHVDYDEIGQYYAASDVFVMPTLEDNWSLVVPEAMACGLPVLCSKYNGCHPELIKSGKNGWVFDPLNTEETFQTLKKCIENRSRFHQMGERSREIISAHTVQHAAESILAACKIALVRKNSKSRAYSYSP